MRKATREQGRPIKGEAKRIRVSFTLLPRQVAWLQQEALHLQISQSEMVSRLIDQASLYQSTHKAPKGLHIQLPMEKIVQWCRKNNIKTFSLFGSCLRPDFGQESDIDILVEFEAGKQPNVFEMVRLEEELSGLFEGRKIDLKTPAELSRYFRSDVLSKAEVLYAA